MTGMKILVRTGEFGSVDDMVFEQKSKTDFPFFSFLLMKAEENNYVLFLCLFSF